MTKLKSIMKEYGISRPKVINVTTMWNRGSLKILNGQGNHLDSYTISSESFMSFRGSLFPKPVTGQELVFAVSYSKSALE